MKINSKICFMLFSFLFIFFFFNTFAGAQANVSRSPSTQSISPRIAVDSSGNVHVVWAEYYTPVQNKPASGAGDAFYAKYDVGANQWSAPLNLSNSRRVYSAECRPVGIAIDNSNNIYVVYTEGTAIQLRIFSGGNWGAPVAVISPAPGNCDGVRVAVDSSGNIFVCWWVMGSYVVYSRARIGGTWETVRAVSTGASKFPTIGVGSGTAYCAWMTKLPPYRLRYVTRGKALNGSWSGPQDVPYGANEQMTPDITVDANNAAHLVWAYKVNPGTTDWNYVEQSASWTGNGFGSPRNLSGQTLQLYPAIHEQGGNLYTCWPVGSWGHGTGLHYANRISGSWSGEGILPNSRGCTFSDVATSPDQSRVYYVWDDMGMNPNGTWEVYCNLGQTGPPPPPPDNPVASFTATPSSGSPPLTVTFDGSSSYDPKGGTIVSYSWNFGDGATGAGQIITHTYTARGVFSASLTVTNNSGKTGSTARSIEVAGTNEPPIAAFSCTPTSGLYPLAVAFNASASRDPDGSISRYQWDFGDGQTTRGRLVTHLYTRAGTFLARLTVTDNGGASATASRTISVLSIRPPLNIRWTTHADVSLFQTRYVTEVTWERNPANDTMGANIVFYRIYRKQSSQGSSAYRSIGQVTGGVYSYTDTGGAPDAYTYTVTSIDSSGHESPLKSLADSLANPLAEEKVQSTKIKGGNTKF